MSYDIAVHIGSKYPLVLSLNVLEPPWFREMVQWCEDNLDPYAADFIDVLLYGYILFDCETDAMAFKLGRL